MQIPTATGLIYEAAMATGTVATPRKNIAYTQIETVDVADSYCWLCGGDTNGQGVLNKKSNQANIYRSSIRPGAGQPVHLHRLCILLIPAGDAELLHPGFPSRVTAPFPGRMAGDIA
ncbi:MAG: hypothetical protein RQM92_09495 [Candidatus Syntrophopropionicum ammoniitolerans]